MAAAQLMLPANRAFNSNGVGVPGAVARLYTSGTSTPATFYANSALTVELGTTLTANGAGRFATPAYQDTATPFRLVIETAAGVELDDIDPFYFGQPYITVNSTYVTPQMYGAAADGTTNDGAAFTAAIAALEAAATTDYGYSSGSATLFIPRGVYNLGTTTLDLTHQLRIIGEGCGGAAGGASVLKWTSGTTGIRVQSNDTSGASGTVASATANRGTETVIDGLLLEGGWASGAESEAHGVHMRGQATVRNCLIQNFAGDGIFIYADTGTSIKGNCNGFTVDKVLVQGCRNGIRTQGADANAGTVKDFRALTNRQAGIYEGSEIGNIYLGNEVFTNALTAWNTGAATQPCSFVSHGGNRYACANGQESWCSTNAPTGSATDNTGWIFWAAGGATTGIPAWTNGITVRSGGGVMHTQVGNRSRFVGIYAEDDQLSQFDQLAVVEPLLLTYAKLVMSGVIKSWPPNITRATSNGYFNVLGRSSFGDQAEFTIVYATGAIQTFSGATFRAYTGVQTGDYIELDPDVTPAGVSRGPGVTCWNAATGAKPFPINAASVDWYDGATGNLGGKLDPTGWNIVTGLVYKINGTQVVGPRKTGWSVDTGTAKRTANATYSGTAEAVYTQATIQALMDAVRDATQTIKALKDDLHNTAGHGLIGT